MLMNKRGEERNYGVLIAAIVAIVAIVGLIILFNKGGAQGAAVDVSDPVGVDQAVALAQEAGMRCGQCVQQYMSSGVWDTSKCPYAPDFKTVSGYTDNRYMEQCCKGESYAVGWKDGYDLYCSGMAAKAWGYTRYGGN